jgi:hypothetical protein
MTWDLSSGTGIPHLMVAREIEKSGTPESTHPLT